VWPLFSQLAILAVSSAMELIRAGEKSVFSQTPLLLLNHASLSNFVFNAIYTITV
jgi:hypothetical protein